MFTFLFLVYFVFIIAVKRKQKIQAKYFRYCPAFIKILQLLIFINTKWKLTPFNILKYRRKRVMNITKIFLLFTTVNHNLAI